MDMFRRGSPALIGVDISSTSVKLVELSRTGEGYQVEHYAVEPLPAHAAVEKNLVDVAAVGETLRRALLRSGSRLRRAAVAVAGSAVITRLILMSAELSEEELEEQLLLEAEEYLPYPVEEVSLDFEVLGPSDGDPRTNQVLVAASRSEAVAMRTAALEHAGLIAGVVDVEVFAVEHAMVMASELRGSSMGGLIAVVDVGASMTMLSVLHDLRTVYSREQPFGGRQLTEEIMLRYDLSHAQAGRAKRKGTLPDTYAEAVLEPFKHALIQQVSRLLQFFFAGSDHDRVDRLVLAGGCAHIGGIGALLEQHLGVPCEVADPLAGMSVSGALSVRAARRLAQDSPALLVAVGLALRSFG